MSEVLTGAAGVLLLSLLAGLWRIWRGPTEFDRMLAAQLFGTTGVAILLLLSAATEDPGLTDTALLLALLAVMALVAFVRRVRTRENGGSVV